MRKLCGAVLLVLATAVASQAQTREDDQLPPPILTPVTAPHGNPEVPKKKVTDTKFWVVAAALNTAMVLDTQSTFAVSKRCPDCYEADPFVAGVVAKGAPATFVAGEAFDIALMTVAAKMKGSDTPWVRHTWWVMPVALTVGHAIAFRHNNALAR